MKDNKEEFIRRLERLNNQKEKWEEYLKDHIEYKFTDEYSNGFDLGYLKGKISEIENVLDLINEDENGKTN